MGYDAILGKSNSKGRVNEKVKHDNYQIYLFFMKKYSLREKVNEEVLYLFLF